MGRTVLTLEPNTQVHTPIIYQTCLPSQKSHSPTSMLLAELKLHVLYLPMQDVSLRTRGSTSHISEDETRASIRPAASSRGGRTWNPVSEYGYCSCHGWQKLSGWQHTYARCRGR